MTFKSNKNLVSGDVMIGEMTGVKLTVDDAYLSSTMPGFIAVENEFGVLYLDVDLETQVED